MRESTAGGIWRSELDMADRLNQALTGEGVRVGWRWRTREEEKRVEVKEMKREGLRGKVKMAGLYRMRHWRKGGKPASWV